MSDPKTLGVVALKNMFDAYAPMVLDGIFIKRLPREGKGDRKKFEVIKPLPTKETYEKIKQLKYTARLDDVISGACGELANLAEEIRSWYDSLPEGLQQADKGQQLDECANQLENISEPDVPDFARAMAVYAPPMLNVNSRGDRRDDCVHQLQQAVQMLQDAKEMEQFALFHEEQGRTVHLFQEARKGQEQPEETAEEQKDALQALVDELDNIINDAESAEFPGMY